MHYICSEVGIIPIYHVGLLCGFLIIGLMAEKCNILINNEVGTSKRK
jgi:hypothetical protein